MTTHRIVLDTDMGSDADDALCLALALCSPEIELAAVTTVTQDADVRARIAARLLKLGGRGDVPVFAGCREPRSWGGSFVWFGHEGEGILDGSEPSPAGEDAAGALLRLFANPTDLELVAVGPLTNVAAALDLDPGLAKRIPRLTVMGGHIGRIAYGGQEFPHGVDYNLCSDPEASVRVLSAGIPTRLVTGDVTLKTWLTTGDLATVESAGGELGAALARAVRIWTPTMNRIFSGLGASMDEDNVAFLHDPLALACVADESFCTFEDLWIEPAIVDGVFRTIRHAEPQTGAHRMRCATAVDAARFRRHFVQRLTEGNRR